MTSFCELPLELRLMINKYCSTKDLLSMSTCSKKLHAEVKPSLWSCVCINWRSLLPVSTVVAENLKHAKSLKFTNHYENDFTTRTDATSNFMGVINCLRAERLEQITIHDFIVPNGLQALSERFPSIEYLSLRALQSSSSNLGSWKVCSFLQLTVLCIRWCDIADECFKDISNLSMLKYVSVVNCSQLNGQFLEYISAVSGLTEFSYYGYGERISDTDYATHIPKLANLTELDLSNVNVGQQFCSNASILFQKMESLGLSYTDVDETCLDYIGASAHNLKKLNLQCCRINDEALRHIAKLTKLEQLNTIGCDEVTDLGIYHISKLPQLRCLEVGGCDLLTDLSLVYIGNISSLKQLDISCTEFTDAGLTNLSNLKQLYEVAYDYELEGLITENGRKKAGLPDFVSDFVTYET